MPSHRPHLISQDILATLRDYRHISSTPVRGVTVAANDHKDLLDTLALMEARTAQTIIFDADQAIALLPALARFDGRFDVQLPFPTVLLQFSRQIDESELFPPAICRAGIEAPDDSCRVQGIVVGEQDGYISASLWFEGGLISRATWQNEPDGTLRLTETEVTELLAVPVDTVYKEVSSTADVKAAHKARVRLLTCSMLAYINCANVNLVRSEPVPERVNNKRRNEGKRVLEDYYTVRVMHQQYDSGESDGRHGPSHSFRYDVRGHFRQLASGRTIWVQAHQRGLQHELYRPKVYEVG